MRRTSAAVVAVLSAFALTSCLPLTGTTADVDDFAEAFTIEAALRSVPLEAVPDGRTTISVGNIEAAAAAVGLSTDGDADTWFTETIAPLRGMTMDEPLPLMVPFPRDSGFESPSHAVEFAEEIGVSPRDVRAFVEVIDGPHRFAVFAGPFDDSSLSDDLDDLGGGVRSAGVGDDYAANLEARTTARPLGAPLRLAYRDELIAASSTQVAVRQWVDGGPTLAQDETLLGIARQLDEADALGAVLFSVGADAFAGGAGDQSDLVPADPFSAMGVGWTVDEGEGRVMLAYAFGSDDAAQAALAVFERQWVDGTSLMTGQPLHSLFTFVEAESEGPIAVVTLAPGARPSAALDMLMQQDLPFIHA